MRPLRICIAASELAPYAKTGGLADVVAGLGRYLAGRGHDVRVFLPMHRAVARAAIRTEILPGLSDVPIPLGPRAPRFTLHAATHPPGPPTFLVDCPELFDRPEVYSSGSDEVSRFAWFSRAVIESCQRMAWAPDVIHANDWHAAALPLYLATLYRWDRLFAGTRTLLAIHNIAFQGVASTDVLPLLGWEGDRHLLDGADLARGAVNLLKTGVLHADALVTVSRTYAREIRSSELGMGLEGLLAARSDSLVGIVNGVDYGQWDPRHDPAIPHRYSVDDLSGKALDKLDLLGGFGLDVDPRAPLAGIVARLTWQKGFELVLEAAPELIEREGLRLVCLGSGEGRYEQGFQALRDRYPSRVGFFRGYDDPLAHRIEAASDLFLMPSRYEPCGLNQMYSLRYGTIPVVRRTGGLADTVQPFDPRTGEGTGFLFDEFHARALRDALREALAVWRDERLRARIVANGMRQDFSWERQGPEYEHLYHSLAAQTA